MISTITVPAKRTPNIRVVKGDKSVKSCDAFPVMSDVNPVGNEIIAVKNIEMGASS